MLHIDKNKINRLSCHYLIYKNRKLIYPIITIGNNKIINLSQMRMEEEGVIFINGIIDLDKKIYSSKIYANINELDNIEVSDINLTIIGISFDIF